MSTVTNHYHDIAANEAQVKESLYYTIALIYFIRAVTDCPISTF